MATDVTLIETAGTRAQRQIKVPVALLTLVGLILVWEALARIFEIPVYLLPSPSTIARQLAEDWFILADNTGTTVMEIALGFVVSVLIGVPLAICITYSKAFDESIYPLIVGSQVIPKVALAPLLLAWFGFGMMPKVIVVVTVAFFPIVINSVVGLRSASPQMIHLAKSMGASPMQIFWRFRLPQSLPSMFAGLKLASVLAVIGAVVAEFVGADSGLGYVIMVAGSNFQIARQFGAIVALTAVGMLFFWIVSWTERLYLPWHVSIRSTR